MASVDVGVPAIPQINHSINGLGQTEVLIGNKDYKTTIVQFQTQNESLTFTCCEESEHVQ